MESPYQVLGVSPGADAEIVRQRYLQLVRQFPPEQAPEKFGEIRAAYDQLRDPLYHLNHRLFSLTASHTFEDLAAQSRPDVRGNRIPTNLLLRLAR